MPSFNTTRIAKHTPAQMFDLVADVECYPEFLPLCESLQILRHSQSGEGVETLVATMSVGYKAIKESFTSRITLDRPRMRVLVEYVDGPFKYLENRWSFKDHPEGCEIQFAIKYEFRNFALGLLMGTVFDQAFRRFAQAFETRADAVYGPSSGMPAGLSQPLL